MRADPVGVRGAVRFTRCDPELPHASELLAAMRAELVGAYEDARRLDNPPLLPTELRPPSGAYYVGYDDSGARPLAVAGGGLRRLGDGLAEIKRMYVRPASRSQGLAAQLLRILEEAARELGYACVRLDTGPKQPHAERLYRGAGYVEIAPYNDNPFACFWAEKRLALPAGRRVLRRGGDAPGAPPRP